jgi:DNA-3-methyladenine glycosylase
MPVMWTPLPRQFYEPSARVVARRLLGCWLIRNLPEGPCGGPIVETEAYLVGDPACHAAVGRTPRNQVMWGKPGVAYVYFIYGSHFCVNAVCLPEGTAEAVLIRAVEVSLGEPLMRERRGDGDLTNGPGKLCAAMAIDRTLDGADLCDANSPLVIVQSPDRARFLRAVGPIMTSRRIGITKAAELPLRFYLARSAFLSRRHSEVARPNRGRGGSR